MGRTCGRRNEKPQRWNVLPGGWRTAGPKDGAPCLAGVSLMMSISGRAMRLSIAVAAAILGVAAGNAMLPTEYARNFDRNLAHDKLAASLAQRDPELRRLLLHRTEAAFNKGGWPAAQAALDIALAGELEVYADDEHMIAIARGILRVLGKLEGRPADCKAFLLAGANDLPDAKTELAELLAAHRAAVQNGFDRKSQGVTWNPPRDSAFLDDERSLSRQPQALSPAELQALARYVDGDAAPYCGGSIRQLTNLLARETREAARIQRQHLYNTGRIDWVNVMWTLCREQGDRSDGLACAEAVSVDTQQKV